MRDLTLSTRARQIQMTCGRRTRCLCDLRTWGPFGVGAQTKASRLYCCWLTDEEGKVCGSPAGVRLPRWRAGGCCRWLSVATQAHCAHADDTLWPAPAGKKDSLKKTQAEPATFKPLPSNSTWLGFWFQCSKTLLSLFPP